MSNNFEKQYAKLNTAQKKAVDTIYGPVMVIAGPGTGKTQLLSTRVANILKKIDTSPSNILCLTFTEAASENMKTRIRSLIGSEASKVKVFTFHGFALSVIQEFQEFFNDQPLVKQLNELGQYELIQNLMSKLPHSTPLSKKFGDTFLHLSTVRSTISWAKQAGLDPNYLRTEVVKARPFFKSTNHLLNTAFKDSPSANQKTKYVHLLKALSDNAKKSPIDTATVSIQELKNAIDQIGQNGPHAKLVTEWRNKWLVQYKREAWRYKDQQRYEFLADFSNLYEDYETALTQNGFYTYDDMLLRAYRAISENEELKLTLQERYQFILVDEYQDTNGIQEKIINLLSDNLVNENRPNLMVVGDDDQAIYRFQGATHSVMSDFINRWSEPTVVVLSESYRSGSELIDIASQIISNADDRLENFVPGLTKTLSSKGHTNIRQLSSGSENESYIHVAEEIKKLIKSGASPSSIAVIAPKHKYLESISPFLIDQSIPINYERREQILAQPRISEILDLVSLVAAISLGRTTLAETYLSKVLSAPYWQLSVPEWWQIAVSAQREHTGWLNTLKKSDNKELKKFYVALLVMGKQVQNQPFDLTLAQLLGNKSIQLKKGELWNMPWRDYYFNQEKLREDTAEYLKFVGQFNTLIQTFSDSIPHNNKYLGLKDFGSFIDLYKKSELSLLDTSPYQSSKDAVSLTTVYKAKGLEWDNVFILNSLEDVWGPKTRTKNLSFKLPASVGWIEPLQNDDSDLIRLLYVGLTRAKAKLYLSSFEVKENGDSTTSLAWIEELGNKLPAPETMPTVPNISYISSYENRWRDIYAEPTNDLSVLLEPILRSYKLSATHLNDFLSVDRGGPQTFMLRHLLKVPELLNNNAMYGDAIHRTLEFIHNQFLATGDILSASDIRKYFSDKLRTYPLSNDEFKFFEARGIESLSNWLKTNRSSFSKSNISERNFASENITLDKVRLTGKIDLIKPLNKQDVALVDYKTSQPIQRWEGNNQTDGLRAYAYKRQLLFYKLLVDNSSLASKYSVTEGVLDFITPDEDNRYLSLSTNYDKAEIDRVSGLIKIVWTKILALDFPDASHYKPTLTGMKAFETDLLEGKI
jgi:DNA helicase-2/ATP-dependent DNA helicase PcrA